MQRHQSIPSFNRVRWFDELSAAIDDGECVLAQLIEARINPAETERLRLRLVDLRAELASLNRVRQAKDRVIGPAWPGSTPVELESSRNLHPDWHARRD